MSIKINFHNTKLMHNFYNCLIIRYESPKQLRLIVQSLSQYRINRYDISYNQLRFVSKDLLNFP